MKTCNIQGASGVSITIIVFSGNKVIFSEGDIPALAHRASIRINTVVQIQIKDHTNADI